MHAFIKWKLGKRFTIVSLWKFIDLFIAHFEAHVQSRNCVFSVNFLHSHDESKKKNELNLHEK